MKCPVCSTKDTYKISEKFWPIPGGYAQRPEDMLKIERISCPHCDGTGKIPDKTWWLCEETMPDGGVIRIPLFWLEDDESWQASKDTFEDLEAKPICRMMVIE